MTGQHCGRNDATMNKLELGKRKSQMKRAAESTSTGGDEKDLTSQVVEN